MGVFDSLFTVLQVQDQDTNRVQYNVKQAFVGLGQAFTRALGAAFTTVPSGSVTVSMTNAPTGSSSTPARYVKIPDGKGGYFTFGSLT
jgi:hypothetical protein